MKKKKYIFVTGRKSYYEFMATQKDNIPNAGYNYEGNIFANSLSNITYNGDANRSAILVSLEKVVYRLIESAKMIRNYKNFMVSKNNKHVR